MLLLGSKGSSLSSLWSWVPLYLPSSVSELKERWLGAFVLQLPATHHRANSAMTTMNDDDHKHFLDTTVSPPPPNFRNFRNPELRNRKNPICDAMRGGFSASGIAHAAAAATSNGARLSSSTQWTPTSPHTLLSHQKRKMLGTQLWYNNKKIIGL